MKSVYILIITHALRKSVVENKNWFTTGHDTQFMCLDIFTRIRPFVHKHPPKSPFYLAMMLRFDFIYICSSDTKETLTLFVSSYSVASGHWYWISKLQKIIHNLLKLFIKVQSGEVCAAITHKPDYHDNATVQIKTQNCTTKRKRKLFSVLMKYAYTKTMVIRA